MGLLLSMRIRKPRVCGILMFSMTVQGYEMLKLRQMVGGREGTCYAEGAEV